MKRCHPVLPLLFLSLLALFSTAAAAVVPAVPAGCSPSTATFTQTTPVIIPSGPSVQTSTLVVSGAGP